MISVRVAGIRELEEMLRKLNNELAAGVFERAGQAWVDQTYVPAAKARAPKRTGKLASEINGAVQGNRIVVQSPTEYASFVHDGTSDIPANPYMLMTLEATADNLVERVEQEIRKLTP